MRISAYLVAILVASSLMVERVSSRQQKVTQAPASKPLKSSATANNSVQSQPAATSSSTTKPRPTPNASNPPTPVRNQQPQAIVSNQNSTPNTITTRPEGSTVPASHPQSTISVSPTVPHTLSGALGQQNARRTPTVPQTVIAPVSAAAQQSAILEQLKQALRVEEFHTNKLYYAIFCGPASVCRQPSFNPGHPVLPASPSGGNFGEQSIYLASVENQINQKAQQIISQQGNSGVQNKIDEIRKQYDPTYH